MNPRILCVCVLSLGLLPVASADPLVAVDFYPTSAKGGSELINSVLNIPTSSIECDLNKPCTPEWEKFKSKCDSDFQQHIVYRIADGEAILPTESFIVRLTAAGDTALALRWYIGGSGGGRSPWALYRVNTLPTCPQTPFLSGEELSPGGLSWFKYNCDKNENYEHCAFRQLYPWWNATRLEFTSKGTRFSQFSGEPKPYPWLRHK